MIIYIHIKISFLKYGMKQLAAATNYFMYIAPFHQQILWLDEARVIFTVDRMF